MRHGLRRSITAAAVGSVLLTGCSSTVTGAASPADGVPTDVAAEEFPITAAVDGDLVDTESRNSLADLYTFWEQAYPEAFGEEFEPLQGGFYSVDLENLDPSQFPDGVGCGADPEEVAGTGAFFCAGAGSPNDDAITYDKNFLTELAEQYGRALVPFVMAHEFGHAIQWRINGLEGESINIETQADCFAGAWTAWAVEGNSDHTSVRLPELDEIIRGYLITADAVGSDPSRDGAHGSYFDRVSAIIEGYDGGVAACRDNFEPGRVFTAAEFSQEDQANQGNSPYPTTLELIGVSLPPFWVEVFPQAFGTEFQEPAVTGFDGTAPGCVAGDRDLGYCADEQTVYFDEQDLTEPAHDEVGDFAVATAISLPYSLAVRAQAGLSTDDGAATLSATCLTGWWEAQVFSARLEGVQISPGDVDEAVIFLLAYGVDDAVFPNTDASGFELVRSFRAGFLQGIGACDVGVEG
ncbi:neutral zinc metallopeptidase [Blastococcus sp. SYSU D00669]